MVNIPGTISVATDLFSILNSPGFEVLAMTEMDEELEKYKQLLNPIPATILLPPYDALQCFVDQDNEGFWAKYFAYLSTPDPSEFLAVIFKAMIMGKHLIIYVPYLDFINTPFISALYDYINLNYGIQLGMPPLGPGEPPLPYSYTYNVNMINLLYMYDMFNIKEYFKAYPIGMPLPMELVPKMLRDYGVAYPIIGVDYYIMFNQIKDNPSCADPIQRV